MASFCVYCRCTVPAERSFSVFKTGFYRRGLPLGVCGDCRPVDEAMRAASLSRKKDGPLAG